MTLSILTKKKVRENPWNSVNCAWKKVICAWNRVNFFSPIFRNFQRVLQDSFGTYSCSCWVLCASEVLGIGFAAMDIETLMADHSLSREEAAEVVRRLKSASEVSRLWLFPETDNTIYNNQATYSTSFLVTPGYIVAILDSQKIPSIYPDMKTNQTNMFYILYIYRIYIYI